MSDMYVTVNSEGCIIDSCGYINDEVSSLEDAKERGVSYAQENSGSDIIIYKLVEVMRMKEYEPEPRVVWENPKQKATTKKKPTKKGK